MDCGLEQRELNLLRGVFQSIPSIQRVRLYGSRAKGTYKPFSDVDITLEGDDISHADLLTLYQRVDDLLLPYMFDISIFKDLTNANLIDHINRRSVLLYTIV